jgi:hypothetical protein
MVSGKIFIQILSSDSIKGLWESRTTATLASRVIERVLYDRYYSYTHFVYFVLLQALQIETPFIP